MIEHNDLQLSNLRVSPWVCEGELVAHLVGIHQLAGCLETAQVYPSWNIVVSAE